MSRRRKRLPECRADKVYWCFLTTSVLLPLPQCAGKPAPWGRGSPRDGDAAGPWQGKVLLESTREDKYCLSAPSTGRQSGARQGGGVLWGERHQPLPGTRNRALIFLLLEEVPEQRPGEGTDASMGFIIAAGLAARR